MIDVAKIEVIGRHVDGDQRLRPLPAVDRELRVRNPSTKPRAGSSTSTTRLNPYSLSGENATTSCLTGA